MQATLFPILLFLHIGGAIMAFGPTLAFPLIQAMGGKEPQHSEFATRVTETIGRRLTIPVGLFVAATGLALIWASGRNPLELWLLVAIVAYASAVVFSLFVQSRTVEAILAMLATMRTSGPPQAAAATASAMSQPAGGPPPAASFPQTPTRPGPPPELAALISRARMGGLFLTGALVLILAMMIFKPGG